MAEFGWNLPPPAKFQGLREDLPITFYHRNLPHWRQDGATYFVTFRQVDSLPASKIRELRQLRIEWERRHPEPQTDEEWEEFFRETWQRTEVSLDEGHGSCRLYHSDAIKVMFNSLNHFADERYELGCSVVMSNHVHAIVRPLIPGEQPLEKILQSWKRHSAQEINRLFGDDGAFWQEESFDRIIRDEEHLYRCIQYIGRNPKKCGRDPLECHLWLRPEWRDLGWQFEPDIDT